MPNTQDVAAKLIPNVILHGPLLPEPIKVIAATPLGTIWSGVIPPQKWMSFYTKLLSGFVNAGNLTLHITVEASPKDGITTQRLESLKATLRELGLPDRVETE